MKIDLNCDLGEGFGIYDIGNDELIMDYVTSVNIACGFHAGDPEIMEKTVKTALEKGVSIGAHPGYPDLQGFGRRAMSLSNDALRASMIYQINALKGFVELYGGKLRHVKPHGALYNLASKDYEVASIIAKAVYDIDPTLILMGLAGSEMIKAGEALGLEVAAETFADRRYTNELKLVPRGTEGAVIETVEGSIKQCMSMIKSQTIVDVNGETKTLKGDSICIHGDNAHGIELVKTLLKALEQEKITVEAL
jgi:UPF0271 protein